MFKQFAGRQRRQRLLTLIAMLPLGLANCAHPLIQSGATVQQHMQQVTVPAANTVFAVAGTEPKDDNEWATVKTHALALEDSGAWLLAYPAQVDQQRWQEAAGNMRDAAKKAAIAADAKDADSVISAGNTLYEACESCHAVYLTQPASRSH